MAVGAARVRCRGRSSRLRRLRLLGAPTLSRRYRVVLMLSIDFMIAFYEPDEDGWIADG